MSGCDRLPVKGLLKLPLSVLGERRIQNRPAVPAERFDDYLASDAPLASDAEKLFQGPMADALTHIGQIAMLRRLAGSPMKAENYHVADIARGRVGAEQTPPRREFD